MILCALLAIFRHLIWNTENRKLKRKMRAKKYIQKLKRASQPTNHQQHRHRNKQKIGSFLVCIFLWIHIRKRRPFYIIHKIVAKPQQTHIHTFIPISFGPLDSILVWLIVFLYGNRASFEFPKIGTSTALFLFFNCSSYLLVSCFICEWRSLCFICGTGNDYISGGFISSLWISDHAFLLHSFKMKRNANIFVALESNNQENKKRWVCNQIQWNRSNEGGGFQWMRQTFFFFFHWICLYASRIAQSNYVWRFTNGIFCVLLVLFQIHTWHTISSSPIRISLYIFLINCRKLVSVYTDRLR